MKQKIWYKNLIWWAHLSLFLIFAIFLSLGLYYGAFKERLYIIWANPNDLPNFDYFSHFMNFDILMSFFSVQVNIITTIWLLLYVINFHKINCWVTNNRTRMIIMNWNFLVFTVFWIGIVAFSINEIDFFQNYLAIQIASTIVTHFLAFIFLAILYVFTMGHEKYEYKTFYKQKELYFVYLYLFLYAIYIILRGILYEKDGWLYNESFPLPTWPYVFLNFNKPFIGNSRVGYFILLAVIFAFWVVAWHLFFMWINNLIFNWKNKKLKQNKSQHSEGLIENN